MFRKFFIIICLFGVLCMAGGAFVIAWGYYYFSRDLPSFNDVTDYRPYAASHVYASDGTLVGEFFKERRYPVKLEDVPLFVRNAFLAAEDAAFYSHPGIDVVSIIRAVVKNMQSKSAQQGASTITQQVVKNLLLTREKSLRRKIKEAILSYRLEKTLSKDEILELYLNQIFFGASAYGIKAAAWVYFHKDLSDITVGEAALLAGLPKAPSRYSPVNNMKAARRRQRYVLEQMVKANFIDARVAKRALQERIETFGGDEATVFKAPYYVTEVRRIFESEFPDYDIETDGLKVYTALDLNAYEMAQRALRKGLKEVDKRQGWRGPWESLQETDGTSFSKNYADQLPKTLQPEEVYPARVISVKGAIARVEAGAYSGSVDLSKASWATKMIDKSGVVRWVKPQQVIRAGDVIGVSISKEALEASNGESSELEYQLDQHPRMESALVLIDPLSGRVVTVNGGYDYKRSVFNRATQAKRQPGSAFKPIIYLAAVDAHKFTAATIVHDVPRTFRAGDSYWTPKNYDGGFMGPLTLRTALEKSRNVISADIISRIGVDTAIKYAKKLGIKSKLGRNLSLALGSSEVTPQEITRAYGVFAAKGVLFDSVFVTKIVDRFGKVVFDYEAEKLTRARQVIPESSAFIMANMMKGVVQHGTGYVVKDMQRPIAAKTGTSNDQMDAWFVGYTPEWSCGVWTGFDEKKPIGNKETGGRVSAPIWKYFMTEYLAYREKITYDRLVEEAKAEAAELGIEYVPPEPLEALDFSVPDGVDPVWIDKRTGRAVSGDVPGAFLEYFKTGSEPNTEVSAFEEDVEQDYWNLPEL